ncbi:hypothetical protein S83_042403 [Arachis hypogaea]
MFTNEPKNQQLAKTLKTHLPVVVALVSEERDTTRGLELETGIDAGRAMQQQTSCEDANVSTRPEESNRSISCGGATGGSRNEGFS